MNKTLSYQSKEIFYRCTGSGKPVILIHGFGEDGLIWKAQAEFLKDHFRLIIPDLPGSGQSPIIDDMSMEGLAEVIHAIIHAEGIESCPVIGHSMGGYITLALMEKYWNHVRAFGLFHSTSFADSTEKKAARKKSIEFIREHGARAFIETSSPNLFSARSKDQMPEKIDQFIKAQHNFSPDALVLYYEAMMARPDRTEILRKCTVPVLFIFGKMDTAIPIADGLKQCHLPEKSYIHILPEAGHMGMMEEETKTCRILEEFLLGI